MILTIVKQHPGEMSKKRHFSGFSLPGPAGAAFWVKNSGLPPMFITRQEAGDLAHQGHPLRKTGKRTDSPCRRPRILTREHEKLMEDRYSNNTETDCRRSQRALSGAAAVIHTADKQLVVYTLGILTRIKEKN